MKAVAVWRNGKVKAVENLFYQPSRRRLKGDTQVLVEEFTRGQGIDESAYGGRGGYLRHYQATESVSENEFFDYEAGKYTPGVTSEITPAPIDNQA
jgi:D-alanine-D-alanine ligase